MAKISQLERLVDRRLAGGIGIKDAESIAKLAERLGSNKVELQKVAHEFADKFTADGKKTFEKLTGVKIEKATHAPSSSSGSAVHVRAQTSSVRTAAVPKAWHKYLSQSAPATFKAIVDDDEILYYRGKDGSMTSVDSADYSKLVKSGDVVLYKNPHEERGDPDDETGRMGPWYPSYVMVPNLKGGLKDVAAPVDQLVKRSGDMSKDIKDAMEKFHAVIHAARVNGLGGPYDLVKIKGEIAQATPAVEKAMAAYEAASAKWQKDADALLANHALSDDDKALLKAVLDASKPSLEGGLGINLDEAKQIIVADKLALARPEIAAIDPGFDGIRIQLDTPTLIKSGGTMVGYEAALQTLLKDGGVTIPVEVERRDDIDAIEKNIVDAIIAPAIGKDNVQQWGYASYDGDAGSKLTFDVKPAFVAQAQALVPQIQKALAPWAFKTFDKNIEISSV